jgi:hypothetical protein
MSMNGLQHVVCRAVIDSDFLNLLARSPVDALYGFDIDDDEALMIEAIRPQSLGELARGIEAWRRGTFSLNQPSVRESTVAMVAG